jgi:hypothetical protein
MAFLYLAGLSANLATSATLSASSVDASYPAANAGVGWPAQSFRFNAAAANDTLVADFASAKQPTLVSVHGHNLDSGVTSIQVQSDDNSGFTSPVTEATITSPASPTFYTTITSPTSHRYWRLRFVGTNGSPIEIGEVVFGVHSTLAATIDGLNTSDIQPQHRQSGSAVPQAAALNLTDYRQRRVRVGLRVFTFVQRDEVRDSLAVASKSGEEPVIVVPDSNDEIVIHGRIQSVLQWEKLPGPNEFFRTTLTIEEDPFSMAFP